MERWIETLSYGSAAVAYGLLILLLLLSAGRSARGWLLVGATGASLCWATGRAVLSTEAVGSAFVVAGAEVVRQGAWLAFITGLARSSAGTRDGGGRGNGWTVMAVTGTTGVAVGMGMLVATVGEQWRSIAFGVLLLSALIGMIMIERLYRSVAVDERWGVKHLCLGLGLVMAFDFYLFADALLFRSVSEQAWLARGLVNAVVVPLLAVSAARNPTWELHIGLSRRVVTDSLVLMAGGVYLLLMALAGYYVRLVGGGWGSVLQTAFVFGAIAVLIVGVFSSTLRARLRVLVSKHFFSYKYDYREEWLRFISTLSAESGSEPLRVRAIRALAQIMASPAGMLWTRNEAGNYALAATWNLSVPGAFTESPDSPLVTLMRDSQWIVDLEEARRDGDDALRLPEWLVSRPNAWLVVPLMHNERLEGFVVLDRSLAGARLNWEDRDLLKTAGREVAAFVALLDANEALIDARQFDAFNRLSAFVVHDLKNILAQLSLISRNADQFRDNPDFVNDAFATVRSAEGRMQRVLDALTKSEPQGPDRGPAAMDAVLEEVVDLGAARRPRPAIVRCDGGLMAAGAHAQLVTHIEHLVRNAQEATSEEGTVALSATREGDAVMVRVEDDGTGMAERFVRESLFRPFATTKGNAGMGVGVFEVRQYIESLGGAVNVWTRPGEGTVFSLRIPLADEGVTADSAGQYPGGDSVAK